MYICNSSISKLECLCLLSATAVTYRFSRSCYIRRMSRNPKSSYLWIDRVCMVFLAWEVCWYRVLIIIEIHENQQIAGKFYEVQGHILRDAIHQVDFLHRLLFNLWNFHLKILSFVRYFVRYFVSTSCSNVVNNKRICWMICYWFSCLTSDSFKELSE